MVERVEVITEGASSIYGADAVAGVINVILKDSFDGFEVSGGLSQPFDDGGEETDISFITGFEGDKAPEMVDISAGSNRGNMVTSSGYDLMGRSYFVNATYNF